MKYLRQKQSSKLSSKRLQFSSNSIADKSSEGAKGKRNPDVCNGSKRILISSQVPLMDDVKKGMDFLNFDEDDKYYGVKIETQKIEKALQLTAQSAYKRGLKDGQRKR